MLFYVHKYMTFFLSKFFESRHYDTYILRLLSSYLLFGEIWQVTEERQRWGGEMGFLSREKGNLGSGCRTF